MGFLGFKTSRELEEEKRKAEVADHAAGKRQDTQHNYANLSNLSKGSQVKFAIPYFDVFDPRLTDTGVPVNVHGNIVYAIEDMDLFQSINKMERFSDETFQTKLRATVTKYIKGVVSNAPYDAQLPIVQLERKIMEISTLVQNYVTPQVEKVFGIVVCSLDITEISIDKDSRGYRELKALTADLERENIMAKHNANLSNFNLNNELQQAQLKMQSSLGLDAMRRQQELQLSNQEKLQTIQLENQREMMHIQREEMQRASRLQTEQTFLEAHQANLNAGITNNAIDNGLESFGSVYGQQANIFAQNSLGGMPQMPDMSKAIPQVQYMVGVNGQQAGPFDWNQLQLLVQQGQLTAQTFVWKPGMAQWEYAGNVQELAPLFRSAMPHMPGMPQIM